MGITGSTELEHKFHGFRLYKIFENGPLAESGLTILDNFIIPPEDVIYNRISFSEYIKNNLNKKINLQIYSVIKRFFYTVEVTPRNDWGDQKSGFLGACVRYENWSTAHTNILRVIKVKENSVSEKILKLVPNEDYIISIRPEDKDFITLNKDSSDPMTIFQEVLQDNIANFIEVFIYNVKTGPRSVRFFLEQKNGEILGCDVAYGKLHELPIIHNEETDKNLVFKNIDEHVNSNILTEKDNQDFVLEETKKILIGNLNRSKSNSSENVAKNKESMLRDKAEEVVDSKGNTLGQKEEIKESEFSKEIEKEHQNTIRECEKTFNQNENINVENAKSDNSNIQSHHERIEEKDLCDNNKAKDSERINLTNNEENENKLKEESFSNDKIYEKSNSNNDDIEISNA